MPLIRKIMDLRTAKAVCLPKSWLEFYEKENSCRITEVAIEVNNVLKISPILPHKENLSPKTEAKMKLTHINAAEPNTTESYWTPKAKKKPEVELCLECKHWLQWKNRCSLGYSTRASSLPCHQALPKKKSQTPIDGKGKKDYF